MKAKMREMRDLTKLTYPIDESTVTLANYLKKAGPPSVLTERHFSDDIETLFHTVFDEKKMAEEAPVECKAHAPETSANDPRTDRVFAYIGAALFLSCLATTSLYFVTAKSSVSVDSVKPPFTVNSDRPAPAQPSTVDRSVVERASFFSAPSDGADTPVIQSQALTFSSEEGASWAQTVETFKQLVSEAPQNELLLTRFQGWLNTPIETASAGSKGGLVTEPKR